MTIEQVALHGEDSVKFFVNDEVFYHSCDMTEPNQPDTGSDMHQVHSGCEQKPGDTKKDKEIQGKGYPMGCKGDWRVNEVDLRALVKNLLENVPSETNQDFVKPYC